MRASALVLSFVLAAASPVSAAEPSLLRLTPAQERALGVRLAPVIAASARPLARAPATFMPPANDRVAVTAPYAGVITRVRVVEGQAVRAGAPLAEVFSRDALTAKADLVQARADAQLAAQAKARTSQLVQEGIVAAARGEEASARLAAAEAMERAKAAAVKSAGVGRTGGYVLRAPISGRVARVSVQAGAAVEAMGPAFIVDRTGRVQAQGVLPADLAGQIRAGDRALVDGAEGRVVAVGAEVDPKTRSVSLLVEATPRPDFIPGRATVVQVFGHGAPGVLQAPRSAVVMVRGRPCVFVRHPDGYNPVPVVLEGETGEIATLRGPLGDGAQVAASGVSELKALAEK